MINSNYFVKSLNSKLGGNAVVKSEDLENLILNLKSGTEAYHGFYDLEKRDSFANYDGYICPTFKTIHIDMDSKEDGGAEAFEDAKRFCKMLENLSCPFELYFSGSKGFHVAIHMDALGISSGKKSEVESKLKSILIKMQETYKTIDLAIWDSSRKFRAFRSMNGKTGLYKIRLTNVDGIYFYGITLSQIKELAKTQQKINYSHPMPPVSTLHWADVPDNQQKEKTRKIYDRQVIEIDQGKMAEDESLAFETFAGKKCLQKMEEGHLPQFNRHDIALVMIYGLKKEGMPLTDLNKKMLKWAKRFYNEDMVRVSEIERMVVEAYTKSSDYKYSCYHPIKKAYCSARCSIYDNLNPKTRHEPVNASQRQKEENSVRTSPNLKKKEGELADYILSQMPEICKADNEFFRWNKTHWERIGRDQFTDVLMKASMAAYSNSAGITKIKNLTNHIISKIPIAPEDNCFFKSSANKFNFTDCTAEMKTKDDGKLELITKTHDMSDYLSYCAPFPLFADHNLPKNGDFDKYMQERINDIGIENVRILKQMLGAALIPFVPRIFFIEGVSNSGKSTLALIIKKLLGQENVSSVLPIIQRNGGDRFTWAPTIGKIANIVLELPKGAELDVNSLKMVRDKTPTSIDRKNIGQVNATLPFLHIYCCNQMPQSYEGNTGALNNRVSLVKFKTAFQDTENAIMDFAEHVWKTDSGGVLEVARQGLADLIESGFVYCETSDSKNSVNSWQEATDSIKLYVKDIENGDHNAPIFAKGAVLHGKIVYENFKDWCVKVGKKPMGKHLFYAELENRMGLKKNAKSEGGVSFNFDALFKPDYLP